MADRLDVSIVVPTYNRRERLRVCLAALREQDYDSSRYEIIVSDDGSSDGTADMVRSLPRDVPAIRYLGHENIGPAASRNLGIKASIGRWVLFIDDDVEAERGMVSAHVGAHLRGGNEKSFMLGYTPIALGRGDSPILRYVDRFWKRVYRRAAGQNPAQPWGLFITNNLSLRRDLLLDAGSFDEDFKGYSYEDSELGYRLMQRGMAVRFLPGARAVHHVRLDLEGCCSQAYRAGRSAVVFWRKHPELLTVLSIPSARRYQGPGRLPRWRRIARDAVYNESVVRWLASLIGGSTPHASMAISHLLLDIVLWHHTVTGMNDELKQGGGR
ncbi:MAG: glycosyltransferase [Candidatus Edwardsbacteria bacterium]|jgi:glycosyltransferase involved in cell wall biosynthesis|nr:glycosyltransferase [Candidatus Edwardsbacteria bacterium]